jgi:hypothetical protein
MASTSEYDRKGTKNFIYTKYFLQKKRIFIKKNTIFAILVRFL